MKILFITDNFPPEVNAPATRTVEHCREWVKKGVSVTVLTCFPNFPTGKVYDGYENKLFNIEKIDGIRVIRLWSYITANQGIFRRTMDYISFAFSAFLCGLFVKTDIVVATSPQFFTTFSAFMISKVRKKPWVFELRDLWPESIMAVDAIKQKWLISFLEKIELFLYGDADMIVALTDAFRENLCRRGISREKIEVVPNGANLEAYYPRQKDQEIVDRFSLKGKFVVGYIGTHGLAHDLEFVLDCAKHFIDRNVVFLFVGDGAAKQQLLLKAVNEKITNVIFLNSVKKEDVSRYLSVIDISLVPLKKSETFKTVIPSKIFESAAMGKPIFLGVEGQAKEIIDQFNAGVCYLPGNRDSFITELEKILTRKNLSDMYFENCRTLAVSYDRKKLAEKMVELLIKTTKKPREFKLSSSA